MPENITVLMSAYNGEKYIREQLDSIRCQKGVNVTLLVRDDGSTDATARIVSGYMKEFPDLPMELIRGANVSYVKSFTELVRIARIRYADCRWFAFADHDDVWLDDKLSTAVRKLNDASADNTLPALYCSNAMLVNSRLEKIGLFRRETPRITPQRSLIHNIVTGCTAVFNARAAEIFAERTIEKLAVHDQYLYIICALLGRVVYDPVPHILYRQHGNNQVGKPGRLRSLVRSLKKLFKDTHSLEDRAQSVLTALNDLLPADRRSMVSELAGYRQSVRKRWKLFCDAEFSYPTLTGNLLFRCKILLGRV